MKPSKPKTLRVQSLDLKSLEAVHGGKGTWCGVEIHCTCGWSWDPSILSNYSNCPSCGAAVSGGAAGCGITACDVACE